MTDSPDSPPQAAAIRIVLKNLPGCTYIVKGSASFELDGQHDEVHATVSGGLTVSMPNINPNATNLVLRLSFVCVGPDEVHKFHWNDPLGIAPNGVIEMELWGVWPGTTHAKCKNTGQVH